MGAFTSQIVLSESKGCARHTDPNRANWITVHAVATELSIAEVERLWLRFKQLGCSEKGELSVEALSHHPVYKDPFSRKVMMQFVDKDTKAISFENFLRGLKWCETSSTENKLKGIFRMLNGGKSISKNMFTEVMESLYVQPEDKGNIDGVVNTLYRFMDPENKGTVNEKNFVKNCIQLPKSTLEAALNFELLPSHMKQELHSRLPEFNRMSFTPDVKGPIPDDTALQNVALKVYNKDWVRLANKLNFEFEDITDFKAKHRDPQSQVYAMLKSWKTRERDSAQSSVLAQALRDCRMDEAAAILA